MARKRVAVAMSGGVDSSVAAALLLKEGYDVIGVTHQTWPMNNVNDRFGGCCGLDAIDSARAVATKLNIPYYVLDLKNDFNANVIKDFCDEYSRGRTPNPCVACNHYLRFGIFLQKILKMDIDFLATGHYARIDKAANGYRLLKGIDATKDQSYFLYNLGQKELEHILFPVGNYTKAEVRKIAAEMKLPSAKRQDSQDICFIPDGDYRSFINGRISSEPGDIIDNNRKVVGKHNGLALYTIGQRHGLGVNSNETLYVTKLDSYYNHVVVGSKERLLSTKLMATQLCWVSGKIPDEPLEAKAKIRYKAPESNATVTQSHGMAEVVFKEPQSAITPGQSVVFYHGEVVLGGGIIEEVLGTNAVNG
ncbi:MAG: tRNA 2-thiouridine(34) synthase MnmA [Dehalococcoidales bacterium]|nr:tRNA 2-thiouridine(34) synthase MnmA [Dehalococcoidales bacterium]